ncbi:MAG: hypothetical protein ABFQ53_01560 [Patescibacteria group bacterium]
MAQLNVFQMRKLPKIFSWDEDPFSCEYYHIKSKPFTIYTEYNILCEAQHLTSFELIEDKEVFVLVVTRGNCSIDVHVTGTDKDIAIKEMIEKIVDETTIKDLPEEEVTELRKKLEQALF